MLCNQQTGIYYKRSKNPSPWTYVIHDMTMPFYEQKLQKIN